MYTLFGFDKTEKVKTEGQPSLTLHIDWLFHRSLGVGCKTDSQDQSWFPQSDHLNQPGPNPGLELSTWSLEGKWPQFQNIWERRDKYCGAICK